MEALEYLHPPNVLDETCSARQVLNLIADKWTVLIIYALNEGTLRSSEIQHMVQGISQKMLIQTLRKLEEDGLVSRKVYPVVPPKVEYSLTPLGRTLIKPLSALCEWAENYMGEVEKARRQLNMR